jgi:hypothetical protein
MSIVLVGSTSGSCTLQEQAVAGTTVLTLPTTSGTVLTSASQSIPKAALPTGSVLQVVSTTKTDTFTTTSTTDVAITGLSATITPTSATSKILVLVNIGASGTTTSDFGIFFSLYRSASVITGAVGDAAGSRKVCSSASRNSSNARFQSSSIMYYDSPTSTSSLTYACYVSMESGGSTACINRGANDVDNAAWPRTISSITVMEIAA